MKWSGIKKNKNKIINKKSDESILKRLIGCSPGGQTFSDYI